MLLLLYLGPNTKVLLYRDDPTVKTLDANVDEYNEQMIFTSIMIKITLFLYCGMKKRYISYFFNRNFYSRGCILICIKKLYEFYKNQHKNHKNCTFCIKFLQHFYKKF